MRNHAEAEDVAQEVFITVFKTIETFREEAKFSTWLYRVTANAALMRMRSDRRRRSASLGPRQRGDVRLPSPPLGSGVYRHPEETRAETSVQL